MKIKVVNAGKCIICGKPIKLVVPIDHDKLSNICFCIKCKPVEYVFKKTESEELKGENE